MAKKRRLSDLIGEETQPTESSTNQSVTAKLSESVTTEVPNSKNDRVTSSQTDKVPNSKSNKVTELRTAKITDSSSIELPSQQTTKIAKSESSEVSDSEANKVPKYLTLVRKESRLREDQLDDLTSLARSLNRKRKGSGERITENTLIRIAVDLLMNQSDKLQGTTEEELFASVELN